MTRTNRYSPEVRERAVRMVVEHLDDFWLFGFWRGESHLTTIDPSTRQLGLPA